MFRNLTVQRAIASVLLAAVTNLTLSPLALAQQVKAPPAVNGEPLVPLKPRQEPATIPALPLDIIKLPTGKGKAAGSSGTAAPVKATAAQDYARAIERFGATARVLPASGASAQLAQLRTQYAALQSLEGRVMSDFAATEGFLRSRGLTGEGLKRHQEAVAQFTDASAQLKQLMAGLGGAKSSQDVVQWVSKFSHGPQLGGPGKGLPWGGKSSRPHKLAQTTREHERLFPRSIQLAANGSLSGIALPDAIPAQAPTAADLADTEDADQSAQVRALAASLGNNPVRIYNWVRNNIAYTVGYGAMQGASGTLLSRHGNDVDAASLLIALLRASGVPARYVYGTIEVPTARVLPWLGVDSASAAQDLLTKAGVPNRAVTQGGQASAIQLEHAWVSAYVDFSPSRGAVNKAGSTWVALDPSFKQDKQAAGLDLRSAVTLNEAGFFDMARQGAYCTADQGQRLSLANIQSGYDGYVGRLNTYLAGQGADLSVSGLLGSASIIAENHDILLGTLPYRTAAEGATFDALPQNLRWQMRLRLFSDAAARSQGQSVAELHAPMARLVGKRVTLSFVPETAADAQVLAAYLPAAHADGSPVQPSEFPSQIPGYLVRLKAELRVGGDLVASGGSFVLGSQLVADVGTLDPNADDWNDSVFYPHAGEYHALVVDAQGLGAAQFADASAQVAQLRADLASGRAGSHARDDVTGALLHHTALAWFGTVDANASLFQRAAGMVEQRLPSFGRALAAVSPDIVLGVVANVRFPGVALDIDRLGSAVAAKAGGLGVPAYLRQANERNAAYGHALLERAFSHADRAGEAASPTKAFAKAIAAGQPVYKITAANATALLPQMGLDEALAAAVSNFAAAGYNVLVPGDSVLAGAWSGQAIQVEDPATGEGLYRLYDQDGMRTSAFYLSQGMGWLALAQPFQAAGSVVADLQALGASDDVLGAMLSVDSTGASVRWSSFPAQAELAGGLFLARLAAKQGADTCDGVAAIMASNLATTGGLEAGGPGLAAPPVITSAPITAGTGGQAYRYALTAVDPQGLPVTFRLVDAPSAMFVGAGGIVGWDSPAPGTYAVTVRADNGKAFVDQTYQLVIGNEPVPLQLTLSVTPGIVNAGGSVAVAVASNGGSGSVTRSLTVDGKPVALNVDGTAVLTAAASGAHIIVASAADANGRVTRTSLYSVRDGADSTAPVAAITAPLDDADVTSPMNVVGTASDANFAYYKLLLRPSGDGAWREIGFGTSPVSNGLLGKLDPTQLANGIYELMLVVADVNGQQNSQLITLDVNGNLKIGQFAISFEDLNVEASGIPIRITRTYDTRRKDEKLDFGYGWSVDYQSVQLRKNLTVGLQWDVVAHPQELTLCLVPAGKHKLNITLPTGKVERFVAGNAQECALGQVPAVDIRFTPLPGTTSTLEAVNIPFLTAQGGQLYDLDNLETWNPKEYKLTTDDNYVYFLTDGVGVTKIQDPHGNTLTYGQNGVVHSNGQSVAFTRDGAGRITSVTDPAGKRITYAYSPSGDLANVTDRINAVARFSYNGKHGLVDYTDPRGIVTARYSYDADGRLVSITDANGNAVEMTHDLASNKEVVRDRRGNTTTYTYDAAGNIVEQVDALGNKTISTFDALGNETSTTDALGHATVRTFDTKTGKPLTVRDPLGNTETWSYDQSGTTVTGFTDARGNSTSIRYGEGATVLTQPLGRVATLVYAAGNLSYMNVGGHPLAFHYDGKGNRTTETDAAGNVMTYTYDANNREVSRSRTRLVGGASVTETVEVKLDAAGHIIGETDEQGNVIKTQYDAGGAISARIDPFGQRIAYEYDGRGKLTKISYPDGTSEQLTYDAEGNKTSSTDRQGKTTRFEHDALNRLTKTVFADGTSSLIEYDPVGRVAATVDGNGNRTVNGYDEAGRLVSVTDAAGMQTQYGYDANGNQTSVTDPGGRKTRYEYDPLDRLVKAIGPDGYAFKVGWNVDGTRQFETDAAGNRTDFDYDVLGRLNRVTQTDGVTQQSTAFEFDSAGNKLSQQDAEGRVTRWEYNARGQVTTRILPGGQKETFTYDAAGNQNGYVDFAGQNVVVTYDTMGHATLVVRPDGSRITRAYNAEHLVSETVTAPAGSGLEPGTTTYEYDAAGRLTRQANPNGSYLAYAYDANGNVVERSYGGSTVSYAYDAENRLTKVSDRNNQVTAYTYDVNGRLASTAMPNGVIATYAYDANARLVQVLHRRTNGSIATGVRYTLGADGRRLTAEEFDEASTLSGALPVNPVRIAHYTYDVFGRLKQELVNDRAGSVSRSTDYDYDKVGNRVAKTEMTSVGTRKTAYTYDSNDRLIQELETTFTGSAVQTNYKWDANGNLKSKATGSSLTFYYWNIDNRLVEVKYGDSEATAQTIVKYSYDPNGNRVKKTVPNANGDIVTTFVVDNTFPNAQTVLENLSQGLSTTTTRLTWGKELIQQTRGDKQAFYHTDGLGSVKALTDAFGGVTDAYQYMAFGTVENKTGTTSNAYLYSGEYFDADVSAQYNRARWYDQSVGRFVSMDRYWNNPAKPVTINKYIYANADPINVTDPSGNIGVMEVMGATTIAVDLASLAYGGYQLSQGKYSDAAWTFGTSLIFGVAGVRAAPKFLQWYSSNRAVRAAYNKVVQDIPRAIQAAKMGGASKRALAERAVEMRNEAKVIMRRSMDPKEVAKLEARNMEKYGDPVGPTVDWLLAKGKTLDEIIETSVDTSWIYNLIFMAW